LKYHLEDAQYFVLDTETARVVDIFLQPLSFNQSAFRYSNNIETYYVDPNLAIHDSKITTSFDSKTTFLTLNLRLSEVTISYVK
jgi:hypothetical protein